MILLEVGVVSRLRSAKELMTDIRLAMESFGAPESHMSAFSVPVNSISSRLEQPTKVVSSCEVMFETSSGEPIFTSEEQLWNASPRVVAAEVSKPSICFSAVHSVKGVYKGGCL